MVKKEKKQVSANIDMEVFNEFKSKVDQCRINASTGIKIGIELFLNEGANYPAFSMAMIDIYDYLDEQKENMPEEILHEFERRLSNLTKASIIGGENKE